MADEKKQENTAEAEAKVEPVAATPEVPILADTGVQEAEKTTLEAIVEETEKPVAKKGKSDYSEIAPRDIAPGMLVRVHQKIVDTNPKGEEKERTQVFQGMVIARNHGNEPGATITVRKVSGGIGVEKIFPLQMPALTKFELVRTYRTRQSKPYYLRTTKKRLREVKV